MRSFGQLEELLVASPGYLRRAGPVDEPGQLSGHETLDYAGEFERHAWELAGPQGKQASAEHSPRLVCHDFVVLRAVVLAGLGIARLPESVVRDDLKSGALSRVLPEWNTPQGVLHVVFPSRRGLLPAVRAFIDFLAERLPSGVSQATISAPSSRTTVFASAGGHSTTHLVRASAPPSPRRRAPRHSAWGCRRQPRAHSSHDARTGGWPHRDRSPAIAASRSSHGA